MKSDQASSTAKLIAASTILLDSDPRTATLVAPGARALCERFLCGRLADRMLAKSASFAPTRMLWRMLERMLLPGIIAHYWHRKRWIERQCRESIATGFHRVVVIGAGFDTLALRLAPEFPHIDWIEIDHPATQRAKRRALGGELAPNMRFVAVDLATDPLPTEFFDDGRATLFIAEGVLMYLSPKAIERLFQALAALHAPSIRLVFSFMSKWPDGSTGFRPRSRWVEWWLAWRSERFAWSMEVQRVGGFLQRFELAPIEVTTVQELAAEVEISHSLLVGENFVLCEKTRARQPAASVALGSRDAGNDEPGNTSATKDQI